MIFSEIYRTRIEDYDKKRIFVSGSGSENF